MLCVTRRKASKVPLTFATYCLSMPSIINNIIFHRSEKVEMTQPRELEYPSLTICGRNKISCRRLSRTASRAVNHLSNNNNNITNLDLDLAHRLCKLLILTGCGGDKDRMYEERERAEDQCRDCLRRYSYGRSALSVLIFVACESDK